MNFLKYSSKISIIKSTFSKCIYKNFHRPFSHNLDINTNVVKDVILYKSESEKFFKILNIFAIGQFGFWSYLSVFTFKTLRDVPVDTSKETVWWRKINFGESKYRNGLAVFSFVVGWSILALTWIYTLRSVRYLILRKGGNEATIVTYAPFGKNRLFTLNLENISSKEARVAAKSFIPLKVKGHYFHYMIDMRGEFKNPKLFDHTAGLKRVWSK